MNQWNTLNSGITELIVPSYSLNDTSLTVLDLTGFRRLTKIVIGDGCFNYVNEVKWIGMSELESVEIGEYSFRKSSNDPNRHFYLKNCPKLKSLKIGRYSFSDYSVCEIENVDALEVIEMGYVNYLNEVSGNFYNALSLELKSILIHSE